MHGDEPAGATGSARWQSGSAGELRRIGQARGDEARTFFARRPSAHQRPRSPRHALRGELHGRSPASGLAAQRHAGARLVENRCPPTNGRSTFWSIPSDGTGSNCRLRGHRTRAFEVGSKRRPRINSTVWPRAAAIALPLRCRPTCPKGRWPNGSSWSAHRMGGMGTGPRGQGARGMGWWSVGQDRRARPRKRCEFPFTAAYTAAWNCTAQSSWAPICCYGGPSAKGQPAHETIFLKLNDNRRQLSVRRIETEPAFLRASLAPYRAEADRAGLYRIDLELPADSPSCAFTAPHRGWVRLRTDHPRLPLIEVKVDFCIVAPPEKG